MGLPQRKRRIDSGGHWPPGAFPLGGNWGAPATKTKAAGSAFKAQLSQAYSVAVQKCSDPEILSIKKEIAVDRACLTFLRRSVRETRARIERSHELVRSTVRAMEFLKQLD